MSRFLIHIHSGPELPNKATLGCLVALTAASEGHDTAVFLAGDGVHLLAEAHRAAIVGQGTGALGEHIARMAETQLTLFVSGMSAKARGYDESLLDGLNASFAMPTKLIALSDEADTVLCY